MGGVTSLVGAAKPVYTSVYAVYECYTSVVTSMVGAAYTSVYAVHERIRAYTLYTKLSAYT